MPRRPANDPTIAVQVEGRTVSLATSTLEHLPNAAAFIAALLRRRLSLPMAREYARLAAKLKREGQINHLALLSRRNERTAANAYWTWIAESYTVRVTPVIRALQQYDVRQRIGFIRRHSLVPPFEGKRVPRLTRWPRLALDGDTRSIAYDPGETTMAPCGSWTLHVPPRALPAHSDPCMDCTVIELTEAQLYVIAEAFKSAWGHCDLNRVPPECPLFGQPPPEGDVPVVDAEGVGRTVALMPTSALSNAIENVGGSVTPQVETFLARLEGADSVLISKKLVAERRDEVVAAVRTWLG